MRLRGSPSPRCRPIRDSGDLFNNKGLSKAREFSTCKGMKLRKRKIKPATLKFHCAPQAHNYAVMGVPGPPGLGGLPRPHRCATLSRKACPPAESRDCEGQSPGPSRPGRCRHLGPERRSHFLWVTQLMSGRSGASRSSWFFLLTDAASRPRVGSPKWAGAWELGGISS